MEVCNRPNTKVQATRERYVSFGRTERQQTVVNTQTEMVFEVYMGESSGAETPSLVSHV